MTEAFPEMKRTRHMIRDRDGAFGPTYTQDSRDGNPRTVALARRPCLSEHDYMIKAFATERYKLCQTIAFTSSGTSTPAFEGTIRTV